MRLILVIGALLIATQAIKVERKDDDDVNKNVPDRFKEDKDDIFMRSMFRTYATEQKDKKTGKPTGKLIITRGSAYQCGLEVLGTHMGLKGGDLTSYMSTYFDKAWDHYDVNQEGFVTVDTMPMLMRFLAGNQ